MVNAAVSDIVEGVYYTIVNGQAPVTVVSNNIRRDLVTPLLRLESAIASDWSRDTSIHYVTIQFSAQQAFDFSKELDEKVSIGSPLRFPECRVFNRETYVDCENCHVSSYTNYEVTYACSDTVF